MTKKQFTFFLVFFILIISRSYLMGYNEVNSSNLNVHSIDSYYTRFYKILGDEGSKPEFEVFKRALTGFFNLKTEHKIKNNLLTIIDFTLSSNQERMWIVDMNKMKVVHYSLVAHGRNSGEEYASSFSNKPSSYQSSLGFYVTDQTYYGKHGLSLYLDGVEPEVNDKARDRTIVMHGATYVSRDYINNYGRLGRSFGCPSIPMDNHDKIVTMLSGRSCLYIHSPNEKYLNTSLMFSMDTVLPGIFSFLSEATVTFNFHPELLSQTVNY